MKKGDFVTYRCAADGQVRAIVRTVHRDGSVTVEARHHLNREGNPDGGYLGYKYRLAQSILTVAP